MLTDSLCNSRCVCEETNQPMRTSECGVRCRKRLLTHAVGTSAGVASRSPQRWDPSFYTLRKRPPRIHHASTSRRRTLTVQSVLLFVFICIFNSSFVFTLIYRRTKTRKFYCNYSKLIFIYFICVWWSGPATRTSHMSPHARRRCGRFDPSPSRVTPKSAPE